MNFMGMGAPELIVILIIALIVVGPNKLPEIAGSIGKGIRDFRRFQQEMTSEVTKELNLDEERKEFASLKADIADITGSFKAPLNELTAAMTSEKQEWERQKQDLAATFDINAAMRSPVSQSAPAIVKDSEPQTPVPASEGQGPEATAQGEQHSSPVEVKETEPATHEETTAEPEGLVADARQAQDGNVESWNVAEPVLESSTVASAYQPLFGGAEPAGGVVATEATENELTSSAADPADADLAPEPKAESPSEMAPEQKRV
ncbi:MAG: twin-arginine translocase TatA/TatE family subunit [Chloroflexi bacterium]|nr:twin-arginine translocase TatA/TatE family subunit [Chloroflexota bacterium]